MPRGEKNACLTCLTHKKARTMRTKDSAELWKPRRDGLKRGMAAESQVTEGSEDGR